MKKKKKKNHHIGPYKAGVGFFNQINPIKFILRVFNWIVLPEKIKKRILGIIIFILVIIIILSFFNLAGEAGEVLMWTLNTIIGKAVFVIPFVLFLGGMVFFHVKHEKFLGLLILAIFALVIGTIGILESFKIEGGFLGNLISLLFLEFFGPLVTQIIFLGIILIGLLIFWHLLNLDIIFLKKKEQAERSSAFEVFKRVIKEPRLRIQENKINTKEAISLKPIIKEAFSSPKTTFIFMGKEYKAPTLDLLESERGRPSAGDTTINSAIIKTTLKNFGLEVEMSEINIGPTVTQYTLKPAEGIKLSKITVLSNNLALALASHSIRIEAPIPGKALVGIEIPNKERCYVRLKELISNPYFQEANSNLVFSLGKDVSGSPCYADLAKMPHLLVAGATGTGKTIFLNSLILNLLYKNSPESLRMIMIDPKRVEFSAYHGLPHLLTPVIFDAQKTINVLKWLIGEMERRFDVLSGNGSRDITSYNEKILKEKEKENGQPLAYIVLIIDELADLMAARGREMEAGIVRLAQMARAVGIHLVLATQRPSVEVITGLIKANITSRVAFQVASQIDSRTIIDAAGAEKLLGFGDFLFISPQTAKPKRIQGAYVTEKEVKKVINYINTKNFEIFNNQTIENEIIENHLARDLEETLNKEEFDDERDILYEKAKEIVIASKKASASLLQRRLSIGYARAARLIDMLEERGIVGPGEGAKPRDVYFSGEIDGEEIPLTRDNLSTESENNDGWKKV